MSAAGYLSGNMLVPYPFEDGQTIDWDVSGIAPSSSSGDEGPDPDLNEAMLALQKCFADAFVFLDAESVSEWPEIGDFSVSGSSLSFTLSAGGHRHSVRVDASDEPFPIASGNAEFGSFLVVASSEGIRDFSSFCVRTGVKPATSVFPPSHDSSSSSSGDGGNLFLRLCARCVSARPSGLRSIKVYNGVDPMDSGPHFVLDGDVSILPGNNFMLSDPDSENGIRLDAVPGAGAGAVPCECDENAGGSSSMAGPDGHVRIFNDTCYDLEPGLEGTVVVDGVAVRSRELMVHAKCTACCTCEMYESIVNGRLVELANAVRKAKSDIGSSLKSYEKGVSAFNGRIAVPRISDVSLSLTGMPVSSKLSPKLDGTSVKGRMGRCAFVAIVRNSSFATVSAKITEMSVTDTIVESSATWTGTDGEPMSQTSRSETGLVGSSFPIYPGQSLVVTFVALCESKFSTVSLIRYVGAIHLTLTYRTPSGRSGSLGFLSKSIVVKED